MRTINVPLIRSLNQQLISPQYRTPEEVLAWMGMIQAQNFGAAKLALAMRMKCSSLEKALARVEEAQVNICVLVASFYISL